MRRQDLRITSREEIKEILEDCERCRLGFSDDGIPYVVPANFGYCYTDDTLTLYFHGPKKGRKMDIIAKNPIVCFEIDRHIRLTPAEPPKDYAIRYESLVGTGMMETVTNLQEKRLILGNLINHFRKFNPLYKPFKLPDESRDGIDGVDSVAILKLQLDEFDAKYEFHR
jgi:nitroimidazol reductase NimA-like FMN-containing flavoprotein (pyridoxamine 5'-phosphate oxidase superfamily)